MINIITMETVACLRSKFHLKQNIIPSWPWSFRHTSCISDFRCKTKYTNKKFCRTPGPAYLAVLPVLVIFCLFGLTNFKKFDSEVSLAFYFIMEHCSSKSVVWGNAYVYDPGKFEYWSTSLSNSFLQKSKHPLSPNAPHSQFTKIYNINCHMNLL